MVSYLTARIAWAVALFFAITMVTFVIFFVLPQPQVQAPGRGANAADEDIRNSLRLHGSITQQYWQFTSGFVRHGSLGRSYFNRQQVTAIIRRSAPVTLSLVLGGAVMWLLMAVPIAASSRKAATAICSARRRRAAGSRNGRTTCCCPGSRALCCSRRSMRA